MSDSSLATPATPTKPLDEMIARELGPGEQLLWAGRPPSGVIFRWHDLFLIPFGLFFVIAGVSGVFATVGRDVTPTRCS